MMSQWEHAYWFGIWPSEVHGEPQRGQEKLAADTFCIPHRTKINHGLYLRNSPEVDYARCDDFTNKIVRRDFYLGGSLD